MKKQNRQKFTCQWCLVKFHIDDSGYRIIQRQKICDSCYQDKFQSDCPLCEEYFDTAQKPEDYYFVIMPDDNTGFKSGIYKAKSFPVWTSDIFSVSIQEHNIELIKELDKNILNQNAHTNEICSDCFNKYTNEKWITLQQKQIVIGALIETIRSGDISKTITQHNGSFKYFNKIIAPVIETLKRRKRLMYLKQNSIIR